MLVFFLKIFFSFSVSFCEYSVESFVFLGVIGVIVVCKIWQCLNDVVKKEIQIVLVIKQFHTRDSSVCSFAVCRSLNIYWKFLLPKYLLEVSFAFQKQMETMTDMPDTQNKVVRQGTDLSTSMYLSAAVFFLRYLVMMFITYIHAILLTNKYYAFVISL